MKLQALRPPTQKVFGEYCKFFKNTYSEEYLKMAALAATRGVL